MNDKIDFTIYLFDLFPKGNDDLDRQFSYSFFFLLLKIVD